MALTQTEVLQARPHLPSTDHVVRHTPRTTLDTTAQQTSNTTNYCVTDRCSVSATYEPSDAIVSAEFGIRTPNVISGTSHSRKQALTCECACVNNLPEVVIRKGVGGEKLNPQHVSRQFNASGVTTNLGLPAKAAKPPPLQRSNFMKVKAELYVNG